MKVALVYDRVNKWGGAERVLLALHKLFPDAPLYTSVYDKERASWAKVFNVKTSFLQKIPFAKRRHELFALFMPMAFESFSFDEYDLVISLTSEAAKGIITKPGTIHICYCLTPTRYLWSGYDEYFKNKTLKLISSIFIFLLCKWDLKAAHRPDAFIAISKEVQSRIKKYYKRDAVVVYPPVTLELTKKPARNEQEYFLVVSRLSKFTSYKRIDLAIDAFNELKLPLKIIGEGSSREELEQKSGPTIEFLGEVSDRELANYYRNCKALIFPGMEDLGLVMIEAQMQGIPVIAFNGGGAKEIVKNGKTGLLFDKQTKESLVDALLKFKKMKFDSRGSRKNAKRFSMSKFKQNFLSVVNNLI